MEDERMIHADALKVAQELVERLRPACERIEIAGSIRRLKENVKDIELLVIPDLTPVPRPRLEFGKPIPRFFNTSLDKMIAEMSQARLIDLEKDGERLKRFALLEPGIHVDLFIVLPPATWGVLQVIRTGPADFSHWAVTRRKRGGALPNGHRVQDGAVWKGEKEVKDLTGETPIGFESELDFLKFLGLGWVEPHDRVARWSGSRASKS
jgi:DNA polymerase/3'-5' exonuclease PolX